MLVTGGIDDGIIGCYEGDILHLAFLFVRVTACGKDITGDIPLDNHLDITCPECIAECKYRGEHPEAAKQPCGMVTHRRAEAAEKDKP